MRTTSGFFPRDLRQIFPVGFGDSVGLGLLLLGLLASSTGSAVVADGFLSGITQTTGSFVQSMALQPDGWILAGGNFTAVDGQKNLVRLRKDGTTDTAFKTAEVDGVVSSIVPQPNGQVVITGSFAKIRSTTQALGTGTTRRGIARLGADGTLDLSFNPDAIANGTQGNVFRVLRLASGKLLVGGHFTGIGGTTRAKLARLNSNGSVDTSFNAGTMNINDYVWNFAEMPDGKLVICGGFTRMGNAAHVNVARLNADGSNDPAFIADVTYSTTAFPSVNTVLPQPDGSVVITGAFNRVNGTARTNLAQLGTNGTPTGYGSFAAPNAAIHWAVQQPDGAVVVGGSFTSIVGLTAYSKLARITSSGNIDGTFASPLITGGDVYTLLRQPDGRILAGGALTAVDGRTSNYLARVYGASLTPLRDVVQVSTTGVHCLINTAGKTLCWGTERIYQAGYATWRNDDQTPRPVPGVADGMLALSALNDSRCVLTPAHGVRCWGWNYEGALGDGTTIDHSDPTDVIGLSNGVRSIDSGFWHRCAVMEAGGVRCWGRNQSGQLGNGTSASRSIPVEVQGLATAVQAVEAGDAHTCALTALGGVLCWGSNSVGQLGDGTQIDSYSPVAVVGLATGVTSIQATRWGTCALTTVGAVRCWGTRYMDNSLVPVTVPSLAGGVVEIGAGHAQMCAITSAGALKCWGENGAGQLGDGTIGTVNGVSNSRAQPVDVIGLGSGVRNVIGGPNSTCALTDAKALLCWGLSFGLVPVEVLRYVFRVTAVADGAGSVSPTGTRLVDAGTNERFTITADIGHHLLGVDGSCGGTLSGNVYTTSVIGNDCTVAAHFAIDTFTITPSVAGGNGTITPSTPQTVSFGATPSFTLTTALGYHAIVAGTCGGTLAGNNYTTNAITGNCTVIASFALDSFTVTPSVSGTNGTITPSTPQTVVFGSNTSFTLTPGAGYHATVAGTCGGALTGNVYTTNAITADCTVVASFAINTFTVTPGVVGGNGTIAPSAPQTVSFGSTTSFTLAPQSGYQAAVAGTCGGSLAGNVYTTNAITANCSVVASFAINTYTVTPSVAGSHGTITPGIPQTVSSGSTTSFTLVPETGYVASVTGSCGGNLAGNLYTTNAITAHCNVVASFLRVQASLTIDDARDYARYGKTLNYLVTLLNTGETALSGAISNTMPPQLDAQATTWLCVEPGVGLQCTAIGNGPLADTVVVPVGRSVSWLVSTPVRLDAQEPFIDNKVSFTSPLLPGAINETDRDILVLFRNGVDHEYDDGADGVHLDLQ